MLPKSLLLSMSFMKDGENSAFSVSVMKGLIPKSNEGSCNENILSKTKTKPLRDVVFSVKSLDGEELPSRWFPNDMKSLKAGPGVQGS